MPNASCKLLAGWGSAESVINPERNKNRMGLYAWNIYFTLRSFTLRSLLEREEGQDLVEYALIVALIALAATAGMTSLAEAINSAFVNLSKDLPY